MKYDLTNFTAEEKLRLLSGRRDNWHVEDLEGRLPEVVLTDGPLGVRDTVGKTKSIGYPDCEVLSQTWDTALAYQMGACIADDCIQRSIDVLLAPGVNIKRDVRCGRNFEYFSEDPYVSGVFGREYIRGVQEKHVGATLKHYCCNNLEVGRMWVSSEVDERTLREIYLTPFRIALEAKPWAVMSSYNAVNGVKVSQHTKLNNILREELGFDGLLMSDWNAIDDHVAAAKSGVNLAMPYNPNNVKRLAQGFADGEIAEAEIDKNAQRVLDFVALNERERALRKIDKTEEERRQIAQKIAEEGIVLLKNDGVLPIKAGQTVSLAGKESRSYMCGDGAAYVPLAVTPPTLKACLEEEFPEATYYDDGRQYYMGIGYLPDAAIGKDVALVCVGTQDREEDDRPCRNTVASGIRLPDGYEELILQTARLNKNTVVVLYCGAAIDMTRWVDKVAAVVWAGYAGERGQYAVARVLTGKVNPSGKLTETFPIDETTTSVANCYKDSVVNVYSDGLLVGYRWHDMQEYLGKPTGVRFPFGFGLSYTRFAYSALELTDAGEKVKVAFTVKNVGEADGKEVSQVYARERRSKVFRPIKELRGFAKTFIKAGAEARVEIELEKSSFGYYSAASDEWLVGKGEYEILVGGSAQDIYLTGVIEV